MRATPSEMPIRMDVFFMLFILHVRRRENSGPPAPNYFSDFFSASLTAARAFQHLARMTLGFSGNLHAAQHPRQLL